MVEVRTPLAHGHGDLPLMEIEELATALRHDRELAGERLVHEHAERVEVGLGDDVRADHCVRSDRDIRANLRRWIDNGR